MSELFYKKTVVKFIDHSGDMQYEISDYDEDSGYAVELKYIEFENGEVANTNELLIPVEYAESIGKALIDMANKMKK